MLNPPNTGPFVGLWLDWLEWIPFNYQTHSIFLIATLFLSVSRQEKKIEIEVEAVQVVF